jgi:hypothetical protein
LLLLLLLLLFTVAGSELARALGACNLLHSLDLPNLTAPLIAGLPRARLVAREAEVAFLWLLFDPRILLTYIWDCQRSGAQAFISLPTQYKNNKLYRGLIENSAAGRSQKSSFLRQFEITIHLGTGRFIISTRYCPSP